MKARGFLAQTGGASQQSESEEPRNKRKHNTQDYVIVAKTGGARISRVAKHVGYTPMILRPTFHNEAMLAASQICPWFAAPSPYMATATGVSSPAGAEYLLAKASPVPTGTCAPTIPVDVVVVVVVSGGGGGGVGRVLFVPCRAAGREGKKGTKNPTKNLLG